MKKILIFIAVILIVIIIVSIFRLKAGDIRPVIQPAQKIETITKENKEILITTRDRKSFKLNLPANFNIEIYAGDLSAPRDLEYVSGGILLSSIPNKGQIVALVSRNQSEPPQSKVILENLNNPHGIAYFDKYLFVAEETKVTRYLFDRTALELKFDKKLFDLPFGGRHITRSLAIDKDGILYVSIGSTCDVCVENNPFLASVIKSDIEGRNPQVFAKGLRNSVFIKLNPVTDDLWGTEMGRDFLGDYLPPDEINILKENNDYGWPYCYGDKVRDSKFENQNSVNCNNTVGPLYEIPAHSAPLGLNFAESEKFNKDWLGDLLVSYHGSWNRSDPNGYKVVHLKVQDGKITDAEDFISGWLVGSSAIGRPVDLEFDDQGNLFISDDKAGVVYRVWREN